jgi:glycosyltransferase involved in cell wall biosynthesis
LRIVIIVPFYPFPPSVGGVKTIALELAKELRKLNHEVIIITSPVDNVTKSIVSEKHVERKSNILVINLMPGYIRIGDIKGLTGQRSFKNLNKILDIINPDIIHIHNIHPYIYQVLNYVKKSPIKTKVVIEPHHPAVSLHKPLLKYLLLPMRHR